MCDPSALAKRKNGTALLRSQIHELIEQMGLEPDNVVNIEIRPNYVVLWTLTRNADGTLKLGTLGPALSETYRSIENDVPAPAPTTTRTLGP